MRLRLGMRIWWVLTLVDSLRLTNRERAAQLHEMFHLKDRTLLLDYDPEVRAAFPHDLTWLSTGTKGCAKQQIRKLPQGTFADHQGMASQTKVTLLAFGIV